MIIFGNSKEYARRSEHLAAVVCPYCQKRDTTEALVFMRYAHIWYIPIFPTGKRLVTSCVHCKAAYDRKTMPPELAERTAEIEKTTKYPLKYWFLLLVIGSLFLVSLILAVIK